MQLAAKVLRATGLAAGSLPQHRTITAPLSAQPSTMKLKKIEDLHFDNLVLRELPVGGALAEGEQRLTRGVCFTRVDLMAVANPQLVAHSQEALALLDVAPEEASRPDFAEFFAGNKRIPGTEPAAHCYCGHQFGYFSGQLGDGAAMYLGEVVNEAGERWELQFKGSGPTPYSRGSDGRKVLRSSVREFLCSEAMHHLGIPTTRAGTCVTSDTRILRDPLYNGNAIRERATVITRIAPTFLRFGSFEIFKPTDNTTGRTGPSAGLEPEILPKMLHYTIKTHFPDIWAAHDGDSLKTKYPAGNEEGWHKLYAAWYREVVRRTASLVAAWQSVGWCHGVLNTDNMSIVGVTIDYGPFGFLDHTNLDHVCNGSDDSGRYSYRAQPEICRWNCEKLAEAVAWALPKKLAEQELSVFDSEYESTYTRLLRRKLGLTAVEEEGDRALGDDVIQLMADSGSDWTNTWRALSRLPMPPASASNGNERGQEEEGRQSGAASTSGRSADDKYEPLLSYLLAQSLSPEALAEVKEGMIDPRQLQMLLMMAQRDPTMLAQLGLTQQRLFQELERSKAAAALRSKSAEQKAQEDREAWVRWLDRYSARLAREAAAGAQASQRVAVMNSTNPRFVLRNWMAQEAIEAAEKGDYKEVQALLKLLSDPFSSQGEEEAFQSVVRGATSAAAPPAGASQLGDEKPGKEEIAGEVCTIMRKWEGKPPEWAKTLCVTCSS